MTDDNPPFVSISCIPDSTHIAVEYRVYKKLDDSYSVERFMRAENHRVALRNANAWAAVHHCEVRDTIAPTPIVSTPQPAAVILQQIEDTPIEWWWETDDTALEGLITQLADVLRDEPNSRQIGALGIVVGMFFGELTQQQDLPISVPEHIDILNAFVAKATAWVHSQRAKKGGGSGE